MTNRKKSISLWVALCIGTTAATAGFVATAAAQDGLQSEAFARGGKSGGTKGGDGGDTTAPSYQTQSWMHVDVGDAWNQGYLGAGANITFIDDFTSSSVFSGNFGTGLQSLTHGQWTSLEGSMIAPEASISRKDFSDRTAVKLNRRKTDVLNLSYGMMARDGYTSVNWSPRESSIISAAENGYAVVVKAAGNDGGTAVGQANSSGIKDYLNVDLIGAQSNIFVGALKTNGSVDAPASMAGYSNIAGDNVAVQDHFLVVGVDGATTGLRGTSFAAPIVAGYSAILSSKFSKATPTQIANRLLDTARTDTVLNYDVTRHGQGEASLSRSLAPNSIQ